MRIAELKGEKTVKALAERLLAPLAEKTPPAMNVEAEAALLRVNPQLSRIRELEKGTAILVPGELKPAAHESFTPLHDLADNVLRRSEEAVAMLRTLLKDQTARSKEEISHVQSWLKSPRAKEFLRRSPALGEPFARAAGAAKTLLKDQAAALAEDDKTLHKILTELTKFRQAPPD